MTNTYLNNDLTALNAAICHYGVPDQKWGKHNPNRRWQAHAVYANGRPDPKAKDTKDDKAAGKKEPEMRQSQRMRVTFKNATREQKKAQKLDDEIKKLTAQRDEHKKNEKAYRDQYEREKKDSRSVRQKQVDLRREQTARYKERRKAVAKDTYTSLKNVFKESHEEHIANIKSNRPIEVRLLSDRVKKMSEAVKKAKTTVAVSAAQYVTFKSAMLVDRTLSKQMFNKTLTKQEYENTYKRTRELFKNAFGDDIADIMRPKLADKR